MELYKMSRKDKKVLGLAVATWIFAFVFTIGLVIFILLVIFDRNSKNYSKDLIACVLGVGIITTVATIGSYLFARVVYFFIKSINVTITDDTISLITCTRLLGNTNEILFNIADIKCLRKLNYLAILGRREVVVIAKKYSINGKIMEYSCPICLAQTCSKARYKEILGLIGLKK